MVYTAITPRITDIDKNSSGDIIIGTRNGVNIYQRNDQFVTFSRGIQARSLNDNIVNRIFVDKNDNIWVGTDFGGINIMAPQRITFNYSLQGYEKGVPNIISTVLEDKEGNDTHWLGVYYSDSEHQEIQDSLNRIYTYLHSDGN